MATNRSVAIVPCRYASTRFPGKPLASLAGKPLMWHAYRACLTAELIDEAWVATDDERIADACRRLDMQVLMTGDHQTGTDRVAEAARRLDAATFVNVQGDEPFVRPPAIDAVAAALGPGDVVANAYTTINNTADLVDHNVVKVTLRVDGYALALSRQPIPYPQAARPSYLRQLGLYAFTRDGLRRFAELGAGPVETAESIEMLRFLEHGVTVRMVRVDGTGLAVDTPDDLRRAEEAMARNQRRRAT